MEQPIYLDYQAATPMDPKVRRVVEATMAAEFANPSSESHILGWRARDVVEAARSRIAKTIGALSDEVIFTSGATEADNLGVLGAALAAPAGRRRILVSAFEHKAVLEAARAAEAFGFKMETVAIAANGLVDLADLKAKLSSDVAVASVMAVNNEIGVIQPIAEIAALTSAAGAFFHTDATQAPATMAIDVLAWNVDAASFSSHKIYGPKGIGALYVAAHAPWRPKALIHGGGQEQGLRPGTVPAPLCAGFAEAIASVSAAERQSVAELRDSLEANLKATLPNMVVTSEGSPRHPGALHVRFPGVDATDLLNRLAARVCAATGSACTSGVIGPSHVLLALGWDARAASEGVRFSLGRFTTPKELEAAAQAIAEAVQRATALVDGHGSVEPA